MELKALDILIRIQEKTPSDKNTGSAAKAKTLYTLGELDTCVVRHL
jgi:hypothetical protein